MRQLDPIQSPTESHTRPWGSRTAFADMETIEAIVTEFMPMLAPGLPRPRVKVVNNIGSGWNGRDIWRPDDPGNTLIELQKSITKDDRTLRRILAHELSHHEDMLLNWAPLDTRTRATMRRMGYPGHKKPWQDIAARFNAKFGADFVTETSDAATVVSDTGSKYYLLALENPPKSGRIVYSIAVRPSPKQLHYMRERIDSLDDSCRLFHTSDPAFTRGPKIGQGWAVSRGADLQKILDLWNSGTQIPALPVKPVVETKKRREDREAMEQWASQKTGRSIVYELRQAGLTDDEIKEALRTKMGQANATFKSPTLATSFKNPVRIDRPEYYDKIIAFAREWVEHPVSPAFGAPKTSSAPKLSRLIDVARHRAAASVPRLHRMQAAKAHKYDYGTVQIELPDESEAAVAVSTVRHQIELANLAGQGTEIGVTHITVRYGLKRFGADDVAAIQAYLSALEPFEAKLMATASFPPSKSSDGAAVIIAPVECDELHDINTRLGELAEFIEPTFDYKPHSTIAYVTPESAEKYVGLEETAGKTFMVSEITVVTDEGEEYHVTLAGVPRLAHAAARRPTLLRRVAVTAPRRPALLRKSVA